MKLARLGQADLRELAVRGGQELWKLLERLGRFRSGGPPPAGFGRLRPDAVGRFFPGAAEDRTPALLLERMPSAVARLVASADAVCAGRFDLLGYRGLSFGDPIDWHRDAVSGRRSPLVHWSRLDPLDPRQVGDSKVIWELNRHQWLITLGQAYRLTGREAYASIAAERLRAWLEANPRGVGINWASALEVALRIVAWCWALVLFRKSPVFSEVAATLSEALADHAAHVQTYPSYFYSPNTHLTGEALGLLYAGLLVPQARHASRWRDRAVRILVDECARQILPDGVHFEQSTCYQRYTVETYLQFLILAGRSGIPVPAPVADRLRQGLDFLLHLRRPDGRAPMIGDADGGWLLPLAAREPDDLRGVFAVAAAVFARSDYAWAAGGAATPEVLWLLGHDGLRTFDRLTPAPPAVAPSRLFPRGGWAVMSSGWDPGALHLVFDVGPLGCPASAGHGHADLLAVQCAIGRQPYVVDPGTSVYTTAPRWRSHFRGTAAHSTVTVDGADQAEPAGPFSWKSRPAARLRRWVSSGSFDFADAEHDAYDRGPDPVRHRRRILFVKPRYWLVVDDLSGSAHHRLELRYQLAPLTVEREPSTWVRIRGRNGALLLRVFADRPLEVDVREGVVDPPEGWFSFDYGRRQASPTVVFSLAARLPVRTLTLLYPVPSASAETPCVRSLPSDDAGPTGLVFGDGEEVVRVDGDVALELRTGGTAEKSHRDTEERTREGS